MEPKTDIMFPGRIGEVSGFDADPSAAAMIITETLLAAYARVAIQQVQQDEGDTKKYVLLRGIEVSEGGSKHGRHFVFLPTGARHDLFRIDFAGEQRSEPDGRDPAKIIQKTVVKSDMVRYSLTLSGPDTIVDEYGTRLRDVQKPTVPGYDLYHIDVRNPVNTQDPKGRQKSTQALPELWRPDVFCAFAVRSTVDQKSTWKYVGFFNRPARLNSSIEAIDRYLRHLMAGNIAILPDHPIQRKRFNVTTGSLENDKSEPIYPVDITSLPASSQLPDFPEGFGPDDFAIVPSVAFEDGVAYVMVPWAHPFSFLLQEYIRVIRGALEMDSRGQIVRVRSVRKTPDYTLALASGSYELLIFTTYFVPSTNQHHMDIAVRDANIARILFGSSPEWGKKREAENRREGNTGAQPMRVSSPGQGCLDANVCREVINGLGHDGEQGRIWGVLAGSQGRDKEFCEMFGLSSDELESMLFADATFFRSFAGKSVCYADGVAHWMQQMGQGLKIEEVRDAVRRAYKEALQPFIENVILNLHSSVQRGRNAVTTEAKDSSNYIVILQEGHLISGIRKGDANESTNTTKLIYIVDHSKFLNVDRERGTFKRMDGGVFLYWPESKASISAKATLYSLEVNNGSVRPQEAERARRAINYSMRCPYGYISNIFRKILDFTGEHVEFFGSVRIEGNPAQGAVFNLGSLKSYKPALVTLQNGLLAATHAEYFIANAEDPARLQRIRRLTVMKRMWESYIYTHTYIHSLVVLKAETGQAPIAEAAKADNRKLLLAFALARFLRLSQGRDSVPNIYDLLPYNTLAIEPGVLKGYVYGNTAANALEDRYKSVYDNFVNDCDDVYRAERLWCLDRVDKEMTASNFSINEEELTNLDIVNGFLLAEDFVSGVGAISGFFNWKQYVAMSASVIWARDGHNEPMIFIKGLIVALRQGTTLKEPSASPLESMFALKRKEIDGEGVEVDVVSFVNTASGAVFPNIANVPIFTDGRQSKRNRHDNEGLCDAVVASTLNEALSANTSFVYILARGIAAGGPNRYYGMDYIRGREPRERQAAIAPSANHYTYEPPAGIVKLYSGSEELVRAETRGVWGQGVHITECYMRPAVDVVQLVRQDVGGERFISRTDRTSSLIHASRTNRASLSRLPPDSQNISHKTNFFDRLIAQRRGVPEILRTGNNPGERVASAKYANRAVREYLVDLGVIEDVRE